MIGIKAIASYIPEKATDNIARGADFEETEDFIRSKIGAVRLPLKDVAQETSDLAVEAVRALFAKQPVIKPAAIDALVVVTQNPDGVGLPHTAAIVQAKLGLPTHLAAFDVSLGCSGYVYGLFILKGFLEASGLSNGLLVTADPYSKIVDPSDRVTSLLFGDAATASWVGHSPVLSLDAVSYGTDGSGAEFLKNEQGHLRMNGRQIFSFAATQVPAHIRSLLAREELEPDDIDLYFLHQGSAAIVDSIARSFAPLSSRFIKDITETGNTVSSSIPILLERHAMDQLDGRILVSGFGVGLSWASALISIQKKENRI